MAFLLAGKVQLPFYLRMCLKSSWLGSEFGLILVVDLAFLGQVTAVGIKLRSR